MGIPEPRVVTIGTTSPGGEKAKFSLAQMTGGFTGPGDESVVMIHASYYSSCNDLLIFGFPNISAYICGFVKHYGALIKQRNLSCRQTRGLSRNQIDVS